MIKKTITYTDYNDTERTEDFYFNLTKAELTEMELTTSGGMSNLIESIINAKEEPEIIRIFKELLLTSYGEKSPDGRRFMKSDEISAAFAQTEPYSIIFMELATDTDAATEFINGLMPKLPDVNIPAPEIKNI